MKTIVVGFSKSTKSIAPFSKAICLWDKTNYSHVYFQFKNVKYDVDMIYQSSSTMLNYMSKEVFLHHNTIAYEFKIAVTNEQYDKLMKNCIISAGLPYSIMQIFGIILADVFNLKSNLFQNKDKYVCSEWVAEQLEELGYQFNKDLGLVKPSDIYRVLNG